VRIVFMLRVSSCLPVRTAWSLTAIKSFSLAWINLSSRRIHQWGLSVYQFRWILAALAGRARCSCCRIRAAHL